ncbi:MAG TPA: hypothetical protein VLG37_05655 [Candidatus Saccharimonadales bacterium]|nr:hypothetical protein [Candidatus Saccharimonadales bacterium]
MKKPGHNVIRFKLVNDALKKEFGIVSFNGKFVFELNDNIDPEVWRKIGIIPLNGNSKKTEVKDLFYYLNSRLPQNLRTAETEKKLKYIQETGLRVASDNFRLQPA